MNENHALNNKMFMMLNSIDAWLYLKSCFVKSKIDALGGKVGKLIFEWGMGEYLQFPTLLTIRRGYFPYRLALNYSNIYLFNDKRSYKF